ncbi:hypothetical protein [Streptomyces hilarionis]|uniref:hypothetical protein n=1 Tax=Streptomyces hilarionis TaxID=2839954 RepID=UPI00211A7301|nr:hypothetical protein [Streptomyces hilarionis]MCQ9130594.1 hypothetical protein [Streptomyces hilarionis]
MGGEQAVGVHEDEVVLEYEHRLADMEDAVRLVSRKNGRAALIHRPLFLVCVALAGAAAFALGVRDDDGAGVSFGVMFVVWPVLMYFAPRLTAERLLKANRHHGRIRVTVGPEGVRTVSAHADLRMGWANYGSYAESERIFALRSPDKAGHCAIVLVKGGVRTPEDLDRLRAILDGRLRRV